MEPVESEQSNEEMILSFLAEGGSDFISGATLSDKLGLSRTAVWKYVETLRKLGYTIEAQRSIPPRKRGLRYTATNAKRFEGLWRSARRA